MTELGKEHRKRFRHVFLLPALFTTANMVAGLKSLQFTLAGEYALAAWAILAAAVFDGLDGKIARLAKATSLFGVNFDSLADLVSFGVAPAFLIYNLPYASDARLSVFILYTLCAALRLARYNVQVFNEERGDFTGLPTPAAATVMASSLLMIENLGLIPSEQLFGHLYVFVSLHVLAVILAVLMVTRIPFPNLNYLKIEGRKPFNYLVGAVLLVSVAVLRPVLAIFLAAAAYCVVGLVGSLRRRGRSTPSETEEEPEP